MMTFSKNYTFAMVAGLILLSSVFTGLMAQELDLSGFRDPTSASPEMLKALADESEVGTDNTELSLDELRSSLGKEISETQKAILSVFSQKLDELAKRDESEKLVSANPVAIPPIALKAILTSAGQSVAVMKIGERSYRIHENKSVNLFANGGVTTLRCESISDSGVLLKIMGNGQVLEFN